MKVMITSPSPVSYGNWCKSQCLEDTKSSINGFLLWTLQLGLINDLIHPITIYPWPTVCQVTSTKCWGYRFGQVPDASFWSLVKGQPPRLLPRSLLNMWDISGPFPELLNFSKIPRQFTNTLKFEKSCSRSWKKRDSLWKTGLASLSKWTQKGLESNPLCWSLLWLFFVI